VTPAERRRIVAAVLVTVTALAVVFVVSRGGKHEDHVSATGAGTTVVSSTTATAAPLATPVRVVELAETVAAPPPPSTAATTAPTTAATTAPPTTRKPKPTTTVKVRPTTTVTTAPTTTVLDTAPPASAPPSTALVDPGVTIAAANMQDGRGTFHRYDNTDPKWGERPCAHRTLPKGTIVTVTNVKTGATTWCIVKDRGPYGNAIIDLDEEQFTEIASVSAGVIDVRITW